MCCKNNKEEGFRQGDVWSFLIGHGRWILLVFNYCEKGGPLIGGGLGSLGKGRCWQHTDTGGL